MITRKETCRVCPGELTDVLDLGEIHPAAFVKRDYKGKPQPLVLAQCTECGLVQLRHTIDPDEMYREYFYLSGLNPTMVEALGDVVRSTVQRKPLRQIGIWLDIGANDGTLLGMIPKAVYRVGIDPARNIVEMAAKNCNTFINDYFTAEAYHNEVTGTADVITSIAMFYDLDDPHSFVEDIKNVLAQDGVWVLQMADLLSMIHATAFDNIVHEHLVHYRLIDLVDLMKAHGLQIFDTEYNDVNGGSLRIYVCHEGARGKSFDVEAHLQAEDVFFQVSDIETFKVNVEAVKESVMWAIRDLRGHGYQVYIMGASTKGCTLLQYFGIDSELIEYALDVNPSKYGRFIAGTGIEILSEVAGLSMDPNFLLVLPWHFKNFFINKFMDDWKMGVSFIFPLPDPIMVIGSREIDL